jgi:clorobiocin biosynthesis protein Clo-hal
MFHDIVILGAGPAGCMAGIAALQANPNLNVVIVDKSERAGHKLGEALLTGTLMALKEAGIDQEIFEAGYHRKIGAAYVWGKDRKPWYVSYPGLVEGFPESFMYDGKRCAIHVPRHIFDQQLRDIAAARGVKFIVADALDVKATANKTILSLDLADGRTMTASYWIDATGQQAFLARRVSERIPVWNTRVARYAYFSNVDWEKAIAAGFDPHRTNIVSSAEGWNWVIHLGEKGGNLTSIGFVTTPDVASKLNFDNALEMFPGLTDFGFSGTLVGARDYLGVPMDKFYGHPDYSYKTKDLHGPNWATAGDAALFLDPILSQGATLAVHYGLMRGRAAAAALAGDTQFQERVTQHYHNESAVLRVVVGEWYSNNKAVEKWKWKAEEVAKGLGTDSAADVVFDPFRYITNLENLRNEYDPFPREVTEHIWDHLMEKA